VPHEPHEQRREDRRAKDYPERSLRQIAACRLTGELAHDEFEVAFDQAKSVLV
jgi:hypothetical protein